MWWVSCACTPTLLINFQDEERNYKLPQNEVFTIKTELIGLMVSVPNSIQAQLGEAISIIAESDFWDRWDTLVDVSHLHTGLEFIPEPILTMRRTWSRV